MKKHILLLMAIGILLSCSNDDDSTRIVNMRINHYQNTAMALSPVLALLVQEDNAIGTTSWNRFMMALQVSIMFPGKFMTFL